MRRPTRVSNGATVFLYPGVEVTDSFCAMASSHWLRAFFAEVA